MAEIVRTTNLSYSRLAESITPFNELLSMPWVLGEWSVKSQSALASLSGEMNRQAAMVGYLNAFGMFTVTCAVAMPLILLVRKRRV